MVRGVPPSVPVVRWRRGESVAPMRALLARGGLLAIPTESSYGLAADPRDPRGVEAIYRLKGRGHDLPLPVVAGHLAQLGDLGVAIEEPLFRRLAALWPAPLTLVVPAARGLPAAAGGDTLAVRLPDSRPLLDLLDGLGMALTATSANRSGESPVTDPSELIGLLAGVDAWIVDGGRLPGGPPSTMLAIDKDRLTTLRRGRYPIGELRRRFPEFSGELEDSKETAQGRPAQRQ